MILQFIINGAITGLIYGLIALAFSLTYNATKVFHMAYAGVIVAASYVMYTLINNNFNPVVAIILTLLISGFLNLLIELIIYKQLEKRKNSLNSILIASIGVFIIFTNLIALYYGNENKILSTDITMGLNFGDIIITKMQLWQLFISLLVIISVLLFLNKTDIGLRIRALSDDSELYSVFGYNGFRLRLFLYFLSGTFAAIVSLILSYDVGFDPYFGMNLLLNGLVAMIIGGIGNYYGAVVGGVLLGVVQSFSIYFLEARWETAVTFVIFLLLLIFKPSGLFSKKLRLV